MHIYFHYNTGKDYLDMLKDTPNVQRSKTFLDLFMMQSDQIR